MLFIKNTYAHSSTKLFSKCNNLISKYVKISKLEYFNEVNNSTSHLLHTGAILYGQPKLSPQEVTDILRANEFSYEFNDENNSVKSYDSNQLPSNSPIEDTRSEAKCSLTRGILVGVFDGHAGPACAQVIAKRLFNYVSASLLPTRLLEKYLSSLEKKSKPIDLLETYNDKYEFVSELKNLYHESFIRYIKNVLLNRNENFCMEGTLEKAILSLDEDITSEALNTNESKTNLQTLSVAMSGAVACVAHIDGSHLHIANVGDCRAVLGVLMEENTWVPKVMANEHNADNIQEVNRIRKEHPPNEKDTVIRHERLLGQLAPLRAFGDVGYKWSIELLTKLVVPYFGKEVIPSGYHTPPYLTAKPEVTHYELTSRDKFLIIASDGLWDFVSPAEAVRLVGEHMRGKLTLNSFKLPRLNMSLSEINNLLLQRKECFNVKPIDRNVVTHLFRNALGGTELGHQHSNLNQILTLPQAIVRHFRDDLTVTVVYFDSEYLRRTPSLRI